MYEEALTRRSERYRHIRLRPRPTRIVAARWPKWTVAAMAGVLIGLGAIGLTLWWRVAS